MKNFNLEEVIQEIKLQLPLQNPLFSFLHNNILQNFEHLDFFEGIHQASLLYQARTLASGEYFLKEFRSGNIAEELLKKEISHYRSSYAECPVDEESIHKILTQPITFRVKVPSPESYRAAEFWEKTHFFPFRVQIREWLVPLLQSALDQGQALIPNPYSQLGLISYFVDSVQAMPSWLVDARRIAARRLSKNKNMSVERQILRELRRTRLPSQMWQAFLLELLFDLKGWSGMIHRLEIDPENQIGTKKNITILDWILLLLSIENALHDHLSKEKLKFHRNINTCLLRKRPIEETQREEILKQTRDAGITLKDEKIYLKWLRFFGERSRFEIWQKAFESTFTQRTHRLIQNHLSQSSRSDFKPKAHFIFCIDDREESMRRHLESASPQIESSGVVGHFGLDMRFKSLHHPKSLRQCPPAVNPQYSAKEITLSPLHKNSSLMWKVNAASFKTSRTLIRGWLFSLILGPISFLPMILRIIYPKKIYHWITQSIELLNHSKPAHIQSDFPLEEKANRVRLICRMSGMTRPERFPPIVFVVSHGSTTHNNPYRQAYGCGACSGNSGEPNSKLFADFANDHDVRAALRVAGFVIPENTHFISAHHDTCSEKVTFELEKLTPEIKQEALYWAQYVHQARELNAQERLQKLSLEPPTANSQQSAIEQVENRSMDLAQPRPEYGHASVAMAVFGRRSLTKGLNLQRRSFLVSYDPEDDPTGEVLREVLIGALPVCANIGLDYFFSSTDRDRLGSGSKLPLNITSLLGVITGSKSDLRIGLAKQMTEIHQPLRIHVYIEADLQLLRSTILGHPRLKNLVTHSWVHIFHIDPKKQIISRFEC